MENGEIVIIHSASLKEIRLYELAGRKGIITENLTYVERKIKGYMVRLNEPHLGEHIWFVPEESIRRNE